MSFCCFENARLSAQKPVWSPICHVVKPVEKALTVPGLYTEKGAQIIRGAGIGNLRMLEHNEGADIDALKVRSSTSTSGSWPEALSARAKGRATGIEKQTCHITVTVGD